MTSDAGIPGPALTVDQASVSAVHRGEPSEAAKRVRVVGAGFSGLTAAYYLQRAGFHVEIFEQCDRPGGLLQTTHLPQGRVESAANAILNSWRLEELARDLGVEMRPTLPTARRRFIFREGRARRWPLSFFETLELLFFRLPLVGLLRSLAPRARESVTTWGRRALGAGVSHYTIETALQGIYAGKADRMSASLILGRFFKKNAHAPKAPTVRGSVSPRDGMQQLISVLARTLEARGAVIQFGAAITSETIATWAEDAPVVIATAVQDAAKILPQGDARTALLAKFEVLPLVTSTVFFERPLGPKGFGCLFAPIEKKAALGVLLNNFTFDGAVSAGFSETWMMGGAGSGRELLQTGDPEILERIACMRREEFGAESKVTGFKITRWPQALPHYTTELEDVLPRLQGIQGGILLMGNYLGQLGLNKILERAGEIPEQLATSGKWK